MKNSKELTKEYFSELVKNNPTAATEYIMETRKTLNDCNQYRIALDSAIREVIVKEVNLSFDALCILKQALRDT